MCVWKSYQVIRLPIQSIILSNVHHIYHEFSRIFIGSFPQRDVLSASIYSQQHKMCREKKRKKKEDWNVLSTYFTYFCLFYDYISTKFIVVHLLPAFCLSLVPSIPTFVCSDCIFLAFRSLSIFQQKKKEGKNEPSAYSIGLYTYEKGRESGVAFYSFWVWIIIDNIVYWQR